ncbi:type II toxin-antitoxin system RelB/DinJ family antitoxin [Bifidobacterium panos]|uniref:DNA-damage-inducible protein J n=1 Tax=Bifidobacterium panos TaxID=2675321 RepID=A0ABX1SY47_9BIFI|nr:type II toxin-antitoxin system RelB/DinJ family antitoxin [Bifidobacterium sp. DSM 109963]NMN02057.1 DNA-damage-inducible protein J [Bifidobacterium sp. DSM 109963]
MSMTSVTVRVDADTKKQAAQVAKDFGFDLSSVTRAFFRQIVREERIPLNLSYPELPAETLEALEEAKEIAANGGGQGYSSAKEMFEAMGIKRA